MRDEDYDPNRVRIVNPTCVVYSEEKPREVMAYFFQLPPQDGAPSKFAKVTKAGNKVEIGETKPRKAETQKSSKIYNDWHPLDDLSSALYEKGLILAAVTDQKDAEGILSYEIRYAPKPPDTYQRACTCPFGDLKEPLLHWDSLKKTWALRLINNTHLAIQFCPRTGCGKRLLNPEVKTNA